MKDFDSYMLFPICACIIVFLMAGMIAGEKSERTRLYEKCLAEHETDIHQDAVKICKERVK